MFVQYAERKGASHSIPNRGMTEIKESHKKEPTATTLKKCVKNITDLRKASTLGHLRSHCLSAAKKEGSAAAETNDKGPVL